ncbi:SapC family protein [Teredinibacter waterburyi]|jgi:SapC.|uniref:SapC family protein n=1 Tax=Teredinibacter waterburyi TaxID=1500538 RepID=UPI00165F6D3C|nr:SapC family protein [Teredinibacter waterburyi]
MTNYVLLNNVQHSNMKIINRYSREAGDNNAAVLTFPTEFMDIQREYPIFLRKDNDSNSFQAVALLGIQKGENLFLDESPGSEGSGWLGRYVPAVVARGPFIVGSQEGTDGDQSQMVFVDLDNVKVGEIEGAPLFQPLGGNSPYLDYISNILSTIHQGNEVATAMYAAFESMNLIEPLTVNIDLKNGDKHQLAGYYTISEEKLAGLDGMSLEKLNKAGFLQGAFLILSSLSNLQKLIEIKNSRL